MEGRYASIQKLESGLEEAELLDTFEKMKSFTKGTSPHNTTDIRTIISLP